MDRQERAKKRSGAPKAPPEKREIVAKLRYIATTRGMTMNQAWLEVVAPVVQAEFVRCGGVKGK